MSAAELAGCEVRAWLPGYTSTPAGLRNRSFSSVIRVGPLVLQRLEGEAEGTVRLSDLNVPERARKLWEKGWQAWRDRNWQSAAVNFDKALKAYPQYAGAAHGLGLAFRGAGEKESAAAAFRRAVELDENYLEPLILLADLASSASRWMESANWSGLLLQKSNRGFPRAHLLRILALIRLGEWHEAELAGHRARELGESDAYTLSMRCLEMAQAATGKLKAAAASLRESVGLVGESQERLVAQAALEDLERALRTRIARVQPR